jgi:hypothetical protein
MMTEYIHCERVPEEQHKTAWRWKECKYKIHSVTPREQTVKKNTQGNSTKKKWDK